MFKGDSVEVQKSGAWGLVPSFTPGSQCDFGQILSIAKQRKLSLGCEQHEAKGR